MPKLTLPSIGSLDTLGAVFALLPGLLTYVIVRALTARERKLDAIEAILHGLAYTLLVHAIWAILTLWSWIPTPDMPGLSLCAIGIGIVVAKISNSGWIYAFLRFCRITDEASWQSTWEASFRNAAKEIGEFAVLHLKDGRRLMGAVRGYSAEQSKGHIALDQCQWLMQEGDPMPAVGLILIPGEEIVFVQHLPSQLGEQK